MKNKILPIATAACLLTGCGFDEYVGADPQPAQPSTNQSADDDAILFDLSATATTRADLTGSDAALALGQQFTVEGTKGDASVATTVVFDNYDVKWTLNSAGTSASNSADWEYVGLTPNANSSIAGTQTLKYWDRSVQQYDFYAYSTGGGSATISAMTPASATQASTGAYTITGSGTDLARCYISDLVTVPQSAFGSTVQLKFRSLAAKVRIGLYETVAGYSVRGVRFYDSSSATTPVASDELTLYASTSSICGSGTYTVYFPTVGTPADADNNKAHVAFTADAAGATQTCQYGTLVYTRAQGSTGEADGKYMGERSSDATYTHATPAQAYTSVLPNESASALTLRCDYTLVSNDGSLEQITVRGATAVIPAQYCQWKPNYAYTYLFKISNNTNGTTDQLGGAVEGLIPVTFDAVVIDNETGVQETATTLATPSITTYQLGKVITANDEYLPGDIYAMVQNGSTLATDLATRGQLYTVTPSPNTATVPTTEANVMDALTQQASATATSITGLNGIVLTQAASDATVTSIPDSEATGLSGIAHVRVNGRPAKLLRDGRIVIVTEGRSYSTSGLQLS